jgi:hypothetical protein
MKDDADAFVARIGDLLEGNIRISLKRGKDKAAGKNA